MATQLKVTYNLARRNEGFLWRNECGTMKILTFLFFLYHIQSRRMSNKKKSKVWFSAEETLFIYKWERAQRTGNPNCFIHPTARYRTMCFHIQLTPEMLSNRVRNLPPTPLFHREALMLCRDLVSRITPDLLAVNKNLCAKNKPLRSDLVCFAWTNKTISLWMLWLVNTKQAALSIPYKSKKKFNRFSISFCVTY